MNSFKMRLFWSKIKITFQLWMWKYYAVHTVWYKLYICKTFIFYQYIALIKCTQFKNQILNLNSLSSRCGFIVPLDTSSVSAQWPCIYVELSRPQDYASHWSTDTHHNQTPPDQTPSPWEEGPKWSVEVWRVIGQREPYFNRELLIRHRSLKQRSSPFKRGQHF